MHIRVLLTKVVYPYLKLDIIFEMYFTFELRVKETEQILLDCDFITAFLIILSELKCSISWWITQLAYAFVINT